MTKLTNVYMASCDLRYSDENFKFFVSSNIFCITTQKAFISFIFPLIQSLYVDYTDFWGSSSVLWFTGPLSSHFSGAGFPTNSLPIYSQQQEWACRNLGLRPWLPDLFESTGRWSWPNKTISKRKSYQVLLCLDSADVIYSLVYEVFSWPCWLGSTHFVILEYTRPVTWWQCALNK